MRRKRRNHSPGFKAKVVLAAIREDKIWHENCFHMLISNGKLNGPTNG